MSQHCDLPHVGASELVDHVNERLVDVLGLNGPDQPLATLTECPDPDGTVLVVDGEKLDHDGHLSGVGRTFRPHNIKYCAFMNKTQVGV